MPLAWWLAGLDVVTVGEFLGHTSIEMTMRDAHPSSENKRRATQCLDGHSLETKSKTTAQRDSARLLNLHFMRPYLSPKQPFRPPASWQLGPTPQKIHGVDPCRCPHCGSEMPILAWFEQPEVIRKILQHLNLWERPQCSPPPKLRLKDTELWIRLCYAVALPNLAKLREKLGSGVHPSGVFFLVLSIHRGRSGFPR